MSIVKFNRINEQLKNRGYELIKQNGSLVIEIKKEAHKKRAN